MFSPTGTRRRGIAGSYVKWNCNVPADLASRFDKLHENPAYRRTLYGSKSQVVCYLLEQYVAKVEDDIRKTADEMLGGTAA